MNHTVTVIGFTSGRIRRLVLAKTLTRYLAVHLLPEVAIFPGEMVIIESKD